MSQTTELMSAQTIAILRHRFHKLPFWEFVQYLTITTENENDTHAHHLRRCPAYRVANAALVGRHNWPEVEQMEPQTHLVMGDVFGMPTPFVIQTDRAGETVILTVSYTPPPMRYDPKTKTLHVWQHPRT